MSRDLDFPGRYHSSPFPGGHCKCSRCRGEAKSTSHATRPTPVANGLCCALLGSNVRQKSSNYPVPLLPCRIRISPVLKPTIRMVGRQCPSHVRHKVHRHALVVAPKDVVHCTRLQAVLVRVRDHAHDVMAGIICSAIRLEVPGVAGNCNGL